jgi:hypothetical protein
MISITTDGKNCESEFIRNSNSFNRLIKSVNKEDSFIVGYSQKKTPTSIPTIRKSKESFDICSYMTLESLESHLTPEQLSEITTICDGIIDNGDSKNCLLVYNSVICKLNEYMNYTEFEFKTTTRRFTDGHSDHHEVIHCSAIRHHSQFRDSVRNKIVSLREKSNEIITCKNMLTQYIEHEKRAMLKVNEINKENENTIDELSKELLSQEKKFNQAKKELVSEKEKNEYLLSILPKELLNTYNLKFQY